MPDPIVPRPPINGVAEIVLNVRSIPVMRKFYSEVMGFELFSQSCHETEIGSNDGEPTICFLSIKPLDSPLGKHHPQLLALIDHTRHLAATKRFKGHDVNQSTLNHLAFEIPSDSFDDHLARLTDLGLAPTTTEFPSMNAKAIFFQDPEKNSLELICNNPNE